MFPDVQSLVYYLSGISVPVPYPTYELFLILSFIIAGVLLFLELRRHERMQTIPRGSSHDTLLYLMLAMASGLLGSRILSALEYWMEYSRNPGIRFFLTSGQSFYGGFLLASAALIIASKVKKIPLRYGLDIVAPALILAYAIGRLGCHLSGDGCWGLPCISPEPHWISWMPEWLKGSTFPHNSLNRGILMEGCEGNFCHELIQPVYPTSLYESLICFFLFFVLWYLRKRLTVPGWLFSLYLVLSGSERFLIEFLRINRMYQVAFIHLSQAQIIALPLVALGLFGFFYFTYRNQKHY